MKVSGQLHALAALPEGKSPWYPLDRRPMVKRKILSPRRESNPIVQKRGIIIEKLIKNFTLEWYQLNLHSCSN
jgi:hypothetical protein